MIDAAGPSGSGRIDGVDLARGVALLGMFAAHVVGSATEAVYDGRSSILFATVAGVSLGLLTGGSAPPPAHRRARARVSVALRGLVLIAIGLLLTLLQPPLAVILDAYGFAFLLLVPLLFAPRWVLAIAAGVVVAVSPPVVVALVDVVDAPSLPTVLAIPGAWLVFGPYPVLIWLAFPLVGLLVARSDLRRRRIQLTLIASGTVAAVLGYGAAAVLPGVSAEAHSGSTAEVLGSGGVAVAVIGAATLVTSLAGQAGRVIRVMATPIASAGAMSLTLYTAHAIGLTIVRELSRRPDGDWSYPAPTLAVLVVSALVIGTLWRRFIGSGPLEVAVRELSRLPPPTSAPGPEAADARAALGPPSDS